MKEKKRKMILLGVGSLIVLFFFLYLLPYFCSKQKSYVITQKEEQNAVKIRIKNKGTEPIYLNELDVKYGKCKIRNTEVTKIYDFSTIPVLENDFIDVTVFPSVFSIPVAPQEIMSFIISSPESIKNPSDREKVYLINVLKILHGYGNMNDYYDIIKKYGVELKGNFIAPDTIEFVYSG